MTVTVVTSGGVVLGEPDPPQHAGHENDMSIGLLVTFGAFRFWVWGDVENVFSGKRGGISFVGATHQGAKSCPAAGDSAGVEGKRTL